MTLGEDIGSVIPEIGTPFTIIRDSGNISGEYLDYEGNTQVTKPFIREFFLEALFPYNTQAAAGELIYLEPLGLYYLLANLTPEIFEGAVALKNGVMYKCNVSGELQRPTESRDTVTYEKTETFPAYKQNAFALITEEMIGTDLTQEEVIGQLPLSNAYLYCPRSYGVLVGDRYSISGEINYKVETVMRRRFENIDMCELAEDTR